MLHRALFKLGAAVRNPSLRRHYRALRESERWTLDELKAQQWTRVEELLRFAKNHSPYYGPVLSSIDWSGAEPLSQESFSRIPVMEKETLISEADRIHTRFDFSRTFLCETSGTSGQTLTFRRDESWDSFNRAGALRGYRWYDVDPWDFNIYFWGFNLAPGAVRRTRWLDSLVNRYRIFDYGSGSTEAFARKVEKATYIEGYSSMIYEYARRMRDQDIDPSRLKMIKGTSEKIFPHYQPLVREVFGRSMVSEYGAAESGLIAFECPQGHMHVNMEGVYVETDLDGSIVVTNLFSRSFPVIRYRLGDAVRLAPGGFRCPCGMEHPVIEEVTGRIGRSIVGRNQEFPSLTLYYIFKNLFFEHGIALNYQGRQETPGVVELAVRESRDPRMERQLRDECNKYFGGELEIRLAFNADLHAPGGKLRDFVSDLEPSGSEEPRGGSAAAKSPRSTPGKGTEDGDGTERLA
jgi:phenylacetate-CoA ligase